MLVQVLVSVPTQKVNSGWNTGVLERDPRSQGHWDGSPDHVGSLYERVMLGTIYYEGARSCADSEGGRGYNSRVSFGHCHQLVVQSTNLQGHLMLRTAAALARDLQAQ
jgi:hypothetical protein